MRLITKLRPNKYVGKTNNLERRKREHRSSANNPLSKEYNYYWIAYYTKDLITIVKFKLYF